MRTYFHTMMTAIPGRSSMKCVSFPLCNFSEVIALVHICKADLSFSMMSLAMVSLCVYPEDYNLLSSWKQKKDFSTPIICSLFLTIKAWRNKYPKTAGCWCTVSFPVTSRCLFPTNHPHFSRSTPSTLPQRKRKRFIVIMQWGENIPLLMAHLLF